MAPVAQAPGRALVFIGFMGAGKTTTAREVAAALGVEALDSDRLLEESLGHSIADEFLKNGESSFRESEEELACRLLAQAGPGAVISLGGGSVLSERVRAALKPHLTVLLGVDAEGAWERVGAGAKSEKRPLAGDRAAFYELHAQREQLYERLADAIFPVRAPGLGVRALPALRALASTPPGTRLVWASAASGEYPVLVGRGLLRREVCADPDIWPLDRVVSRPVCVTDETVGPLYGGCLESLCPPIAIEAGERNKTLASAEVVWSALVAAGMTRADHVVALGGGVVGDLAGFCAATYQRGVPVVHVPTTLVAQVDSAYGGKTGVDLPEAKNYVGAYHQPAGVMVDPDTLATLPAEELAAGYAEVLKTALIAGGSLWVRVLGDGPVDERAILACARTKLKIVSEDERDCGRRQSLNLGHTVAHAVEAVTDYARYRHGEAVGLGLLAALRLSGKDVLRQQVRELLAAHGLPVALEADIDVGALVEATMRDKKRVGPRVPFVLVEGPGDVRTGCDVSEGELRGAVAELQRARVGS